MTKSIEEKKEASRKASKKYWKNHREDMLLKCRGYRNKNKEKIRDYYRKWYAENGRNRAANYMEIILEYQQKYPERVRARCRLAYALKKGKIKLPLKCEKCGKEGRVNAHHVNYSKALDIQWLCYSCHKLEHISKKNPLDKAPGKTEDYL